MAHQFLHLLTTFCLLAQTHSAPASNPNTGPGFLSGSIQHSTDATGQNFIPTMELGVGSPPQKVTVILDTGSSDLIVPQTGSQICQDKQQQCTSNGKNFSTGSFDRTKSAGVSAVNTPVDTSFVNGVTLQGTYVKAGLTIGNSSVNSIQLGVVEQGTLPPNTPLFPVFGIGPKQGEGVAKPYQNAPAQMKDGGAIKANAFGLYLNDFRSSEGSITFGGVDTAKFQGNLKAAPLVKDNNGLLSSFVIDFSSMQLIAGNSSVPAKPNTNLAPQNGLSVALLDSGNPSVLVPTASVRTLAKALGSQFDEKSGFVGTVPCSMAQQGMSISFGFNNDQAKVQVPLELMMTPIPQSGGADCDLPIGATDDLVSLGSPMMQAAYIVFDMDNQRLLMAQAVLNATSSNIQEYTAYMSSTN